MLGYSFLFNANWTFIGDWHQARCPWNFKNEKSILEAPCFLLDPYSYKDIIHDCLRINIKSVT